MNEFDDSTPHDDQCFDRLVDGELSREEYNDLLGSLDQQPDGWRRCAIAFLEAQALWQEFGDLTNESRVSHQTAPSTVPSKDRTRRWPGLLAVAASFLIAFGLGLVFRGRWPEVPSGTEGMPVVKDHERPETPAEPPSRNTEIVESPIPVADQPSRYRGNVRLVVDRPDGSGSQEFEAPVYDWSPENAWMLSEDRLRVPPEVRRVFQRMGREVRWDQELIPLETDDGQRVLIPFRQLEFVPVGGQRYQ